MDEIKTMPEVRREGWFRVSSNVARIAASSTGVSTAVAEAAELLQQFGPTALSLVAAPEQRAPKCFVEGFSAAFADRLTSLYLRGYRLTDPVKGAMNIRSDYILWPELALEGVGLFAAWPLVTAGRSVGELHIGLFDSSDLEQLPPDEFMETFAGALALAVDRNELLSVSEQHRDAFQWHQKLVSSMVHGEEDAVCVTDSLGRILLLNPAGEMMLGVREGAVLGRRLHETDSRFCPIGRTEDELGSADKRVMLLRGTDRERGIEGIRLSRFEHGGRQYLTWILQYTVARTPIALPEDAFELNELVQHERLAALSCDQAGIITAHSASLADLLGAVPARVENGASIYDCTALRISGVAKAMKRCMQTGEPQVTAHELYHRARGGMHLSVHCTPVFLENRVLGGVQAVIEDATDIVRTRTSLMRSEERYRVFFNNAPICLVELDLSAFFDEGLGVDEIAELGKQGDVSVLLDKIGVSAVNPAAAEMYGTASCTELTVRWVALNVRASEGLFEMFSEFGTGRSSAAFEAECETVKGERLHVSIRAAVAPGHEADLSRILLSIVDISRIKSMEQALRLQLSLERLVSRISARFASLSPDRTTDGIADAVAEVGMVLGLDTAALYEPDGREGVVARYIWAGPFIHDLPLRISSFLTADYPLFAGAVRELNVVRVDSPWDLPETSNERRILDDLNISALLMIPLAVQGRFRGLLALPSRRENRWEEENVALIRVLADVMVSALDREQLERERRESEDLLRTVFQSMVGGLIVADRDDRIILANPSAASSFKLAGPSELIGRPLGETIPGAEGMLRISAPGEQQQIVIPLGDGTRSTFGFTSASAASGRRIVLFRDLSPMIQAAQRQKRAEELARIGMVTAKLSHEIKNPLASILLGLRTVEESETVSAEDKSVLQSVLEEVRYLKSFVGNLLDSTRFQNIVPSTQGVMSILLRTIEMQARAVERSGVSLCLADGSADTVISSDSGALIRAMGNLVTNANEACDGKGRIEVGCRVLTSSEVNRRFPGFRGGVVCLFVEDDGPGLPAEVLDNLFVPFTTTKSFGNGLGLSVVRETVAGHGGVIEVVTPTRPGQGGTRFEILLVQGGRPSCLDVHSTDESCSECPVPCGCPVREVDGYLACWVIKGRASLAESGHWNEECVTCPAYLAGNLEHFYRRAGQKGKSS